MAVWSAMPQSWMAEQAILAVSVQRPVGVLSGLVPLLNSSTVQALRIRFA
jgi:hypothetical protein